MEVKDKVIPFSKRSRDLLDEMMAREQTDEMGLLDLIFLEEILAQKKQDSPDSQGTAA